jgi:hypothetical protein
MRDAMIRRQQIQAKIDAVHKQRADAIASADADFGKACREAADRRSDSYRQIKGEYDPRIADLEEQRKAAELDARHLQNGPT